MARISPNVSTDASTLRNTINEARGPGASSTSSGAQVESIDNAFCSKLVTASLVKELTAKSVKIACPLQQEDVVAACTKRIQTETENCTAKVEKMLAARVVYVEAVSGPPSQDEISKIIRITAENIAKYQTIIMNKMAEYENKKMNAALTLVVASMPSSMRSMFGDQKFLNTQNVVEQFTGITNSLADQMEGILLKQLNIPNLIKQADAQAASGVLWADPISQSAVSGLLNLGASSLDLGGGSGGGAGSSDGSSGGGSDDVITVPSGPYQPTTPKVPMCYAEDIVAQGIAVNKDKIEKIAQSQHTNYNRFLDGVKSQLEEMDKKMEDKSEDRSDVGKVSGISDEAPAAAYEPIGGTNYYTENGVPCTLAGATSTGTGFKVNIKVGTGGWYDNGFATINDGGAGYTVNVANSGSTSGTGSTEGAATTGGSGSGIKVNYTIESGVITGITTNTVGSNYKDGDILTIVNNASGTPTTNSTFTVDKVRGVINRMSAGGIKINDAGTGYKIGDVLIISQQGSGQNSAIMITQVLDFGSAKATAGPVTPGDNQGSNGRWVPPKLPKKPKVDPMQKMGDMLQMLGGMQGSVTEALDFVNLKGDIFPFEVPPNMAVSDFYTLVTGGAGVPGVEMPDVNAINEAVSTITDVAAAVESLDFAIPTPNTPSISLDSFGKLAENVDDAKGALNLGE